MSDHVRGLRPARVPWNVATDAAPGARFVTPEEYRLGVPDSVRRSMVKWVVIEALANAADTDGVLLDFDQPAFFATHVANVLDQELEDDEEASPLVYDRFAAMALMDCMTSLMLQDGLLANRGNGDSADFRLTLPTGPEHERAGPRGRAPQPQPHRPALN